MGLQVGSGLGFSSKGPGYAAWISEDPSTSDSEARQHQSRIVRDTSAS